MRTCSQSAQRTFCLHLHYRSRWAGLTTCSASNRRSLANWAGLSWRNRQSHLKASLKKALCRRMSCFFWRCLGGALNVCINASWQATPLRRSQHVHVNLPNDSGVLPLPICCWEKEAQFLAERLPVYHCTKLFSWCTGVLVRAWCCEPFPFDLTPGNPGKAIAFQIFSIWARALLNWKLRRHSIGRACISSQVSSFQGILPIWPGQLPRLHSKVLAVFSHWTLGYLQQQSLKRTCLVSVHDVMSIPFFFWCCMQGFWCKDHRKFNTIQWLDLPTHLLLEETTRIICGGNASITVAGILADRFDIHRPKLWPGFSLAPRCTKYTSIVAYCRGGWWETFSLFGCRISLWLSWWRIIERAPRLSDGNTDLQPYTGDPWRSKMKTVT